MEHKILDNKRENTVYNNIKNEFNFNTKFDAVVNCLSIFALDKLKYNLSNSKKANIIITNPNFKKLEILGNSYERSYRNKLGQKYIANEIKELLKENLNLFIAEDNTLGSNNFISIENENEHINITGSNLTLDGLGILPTDNMYFLNYLKTSEKQNIPIENFKEKAIPFDSFYSYLDELTDPNSAEFIYFLCLNSIFSDAAENLEENFKIETGIKDTKIWNMLYKFQEDGARGIIDKLNKHSGCILADSVGLGKTFTALAVVKYFELRNDRVLVLAPKRLRENWTIYTANDSRNPLLEDRFSYKVLNHTDLSRHRGMSGSEDLEHFIWSNYDLVVIDESHNFRNNNSTEDTVSRYERLMEDVIKSGVPTKVLMLSATPVNTRMNDLKNQIAFITEDNDKALEKEGIKSIEHSLRIAQTRYNEWVKLEENQRTSKGFTDIVNDEYFKILDAVTIARSRKHIEKYYGLKEIGEFPERLKPKNFYTEISKDYIDIKDIYQTIGDLNFAVYSPTAYIMPSRRKKYEKYDINLGHSKFLQEDREHALVGLIRTNYLKRLESSIYSFGITLARTLEKIDNELDKINKVNQIIDMQNNLEEFTDDEDIDIEDFTTGDKIKIDFVDIDLLKWEQDLRLDQNRLEKLLKETAVVRPEKDEKLKQLTKIIEEKIETPINNNNKKVLIFSAFADTATYIYENLSKYFKEKYNVNSALVQGAGQNQTTMKNVRTTNMNDILINFSPKSKGRKVQGEEIDILIATDCISEGQNLQDCDYLINYDIHWNPVRITQRFGRIDRIGSENKYIQLVSFWPMRDLDDYINLEHRVKNRMVLSDVSATGEENPFNLDPKEMNDLKYRKEQLKQMQDQVLDLEDISGSISITDLTFNDFKIDLENLLKKYNKEYFTGLYAVANIPKELKEEYKPGTIFILKQKIQNKGEENYNPFYPYYISYISDEGEILSNYKKTKTSLDILKKIGMDNIEVIEDLEKNMKKETKDFKDMKRYTNLLDLAIKDIVGASEEDELKSLFTPGGTNFSTSNKDLDSFEVLAYMVVR